ncbi:dienelactone hydrolase family protein [Leucobacter chromiireducens]|uniref:Dienelactone hydrolase domain-containing protein n=1 Tax=Leucobacter chromiireducens subsp. solipictus TaxID=398235 RepID=A0ABS1SI45_9MICO|nr:dienelactone hydrolase family protein [Leucobacter chromiireducens]MBL3680218.1 hypothetical protein [Leucobacter chromiireducens subsp. solipictus]
MMDELTTRDIAYRHGGTEMLGVLCAPAGARELPAVLLVHDAFGLGGDTIALARELAALGLAVFAADVWSHRYAPTEAAELGSLIDAMVADRAEWLGRIAAAHAAAAAQPEIDAQALVGLGHCFGGSSVLEHLRVGGQLRGVVAIHAGLDLLAPGWESALGDSEGGCAPRVLLCTGADDPMATAAQRAELQAGLDQAAIEWETHLYSGTVHGFTSPHSAQSPRPDVVMYHPGNAARARQATLRFLAEAFPGRLAFPTPENEFA